MADKDNESWSKGKVMEEVFQIIKGELGDSFYDEKRVQSWINSICEKTMAKISSMGKESASKYAVTCTILQRTGAGVHLSNSCFWDKRRDECITVQFPKKARTPTKMICLVNIYAIALQIDEEL